MATNTVFLGKVYGATNTILTNAETDLAAAIESVSANPSEQPSQATLLQLQYKLQVFNFFAEFCSTAEKKLGDAFQSIVRNF